MFFTGTIGIMAGVVFASQNSCYRLMGFRENAREVQTIKYRCVSFYCRACFAHHTDAARARADAALTL